MYVKESRLGSVMVRLTVILVFLVAVVFAKVGSTKVNEGDVVSTVNVLVSVEFSSPELFVVETK